MDNKTASKMVLWDKTSVGIQQRLRQPKILSKSLNKPSSQSSSQSSGIEAETIGLSGEMQKLQCSQKNNLSIQEVAAKSNLKADAPEFIPFSSMNSRTKDYVEPIHNNTNSVQSRLRVHKTEMNYASDNASLQADVDDYSSDIKRVKHIISALTRDPGQFNDLLEIFLETLSPHFDDITAISTITQTLVDEALIHPNFRYTGAKLCWYIEQASPEFRAELYMRCKKKIEDSPDIQNVSLFIAELYTQLPHLNMYGVLLISSFQKLFEKGGNDNIKCLCQALKLTGYSLERSNNKELSEIFMKLKKVEKSVSGTASILLNSVLTLRSSNWGHTSDPSESENEQDCFDYGDVHHDTVFYSTDGEKLTKEENEFIAAHMNYSDEYLSDSDPDELCDPEPEMDEEIQAAFKEFLEFSSKR